jgi:hypothetical protein
MTILLIFMMYSIFLQPTATVQKEEQLQDKTKSLSGYFHSLSSQDQVFDVTTYPYKQTKINTSCVLMFYKSKFRYK